MTLPIAIPDSPSASDDSSTQPRTPVSPSLSNNVNNSNNNNKQRKASRRANTAERRATHNAVERQRRETLNGRFLDLAALLPNLSQIRRPSKSSIVNSSIAHIHASRRHRLLASRELRSVKLEADALRRELNEWRDRAGIPRVEEPVRGEGFSMVLSGELEVLPVPGVGGGLGGLMEEGMDGDDDGDYGFLDDGDHLPQGQGMEEIFVPEPQVQQTVPTMMARIPSQQQIAHQGGNVQERMERLKRLERLDRLDRIERSQGPMVASPTAVAFDSPAVPGMYEPRIIPGGYQMMQGGNNGMGMGMQGGMGQMGMGMSPYEQMQGKGFNNGMGMPMQHPHQMQRPRSGSMSASSSGSASPPLPQWAHGPQGPQQGMGQGQMQMGQQGMMMGGMGGMGGQNVAFAMMM